MTAIIENRNLKQWLDLKTQPMTLSTGNAPETIEVLAQIAEKISAMETADFFQRRGAGASTAKADLAWAKVGNRNPVAEDRWTQD
jgi:hypothetical protein